MKRLLLFSLLSSFCLLGTAQKIILNELYTDPSTGDNEFIELYNSSFLTINTDIYTIVTYYRNGSGANTEEGVYVLNLPNSTVEPGKHFVTGSNNPISIQQQPQANVSVLNWNDLGATGYLRKYAFVGGAFQSPTTPPLGFNDFLQNTSNGNYANYTVLVFAGTDPIPVNVFCGGSSANDLLPALRAMGALSVDVPTLAGTYTTPLQIDFSSINASKIEFVNPAAGSSNGYRRTSDGQCGTWVKSNNPASHNPGFPNGVAKTTGSLTVSEPQLQPIPGGNLVKVTYTIEPNSSSAAFPLNVRYIDDYGTTDTDPNDLTNELFLPNSSFDITDNYEVLGSASSTINAPQTVVTDFSPWYTSAAYLQGYTSPQRRSRALWIIFETPQNCFDQVRYAQSQEAQLPLPVSFKSFSAKRNKQNVVLSWQTASEQNNAGFALERNINGNWTEIAFVPSHSNTGNSSSELSYTYNDLNNHKGISQYRIRQMDLDAKSSYSAVRSVQGEGAGPKMVIYPNPSFDGRVQIVFEDASSSRHIVISDMSGRIVRQVSNVLNSSITLDGLTNGLYTARVINQATGESTLQKFVIQQK